MFLSGFLQQVKQRTLFSNMSEILKILKKFICSSRESYTASGVLISNNNNTDVHLILEGSVVEACRVNNINVVEGAENNLPDLHRGEVD